MFHLKFLVYFSEDKFAFERYRWIILNAFVDISDEITYESDVPAPSAPLLEEVDGDYQSFTTWSVEKVCEWVSLL